MWETLKKAFTKGPDLDVHDLYDWFPGIESGEEEAGREARAQKLKDLEGKIPGLPQAMAPGAEGLFADMRRQLRTQPGTGYEQGPYYKSMLSDIAEREKARGYTAGSSLASRGGRSTGAYGAGRAASTDRADAMDRLRLQAAGQAHQAKARNDLAQWSNSLRLAGFAQGVWDKDFERQFRIYGEQRNLTAGQIDLELQEIRDRWEQLAAGAQIAISGYDTLTGGEKGREG
tara:strand:- start:159 stop:848 length:690 start_codon:yes stop_codon:yes gene_type:complete